MSNEEFLRDLLRRWRSGDQEAAAEIYKRYEARVQQLAERKLGRYLWHRVSPDDVMMMALNSVLRLTAENSCVLDRNGSLWGLVANIARNKVLQQVEFHAAPKRDVRREKDSDRIVESRRLPEEPVDSEPTPEEAACWVDTLDLIRGRLKPDSFAIVAMKLEGYSVPEIAAELGVARQTISNKLRHIEGRLRYILDQHESVEGRRDGDGPTDFPEEGEKTHRETPVSG